ncbi:MAG: tRNA pseudouridine(55) synthase TruB [Clostridia bacterium]|nr:tRNA pseudouridine(55) synthase TruB [Clostridia bacterium]
MTGFINIFKEEGVSSAFVTNRVKWLCRTPAGHMGTLDPLASGVLPVGVGNATRLFDYFSGKTKVYTARFRFGVTTDTLDREGELILGGRVPNTEEIARALPSLTGEIEQIPPKYSAKSVNGKRGYELARAGEEFSLPAKKVRVESFRLLEQTGADEFSFEIVCGGGTYIRALARDLAGLLDTNGYMSALTRNQSGVFTEETAVRLDTLTRENVEEYLIPTENVLPYPALGEVDGRIFNGVSVPCAQKDGLYKLYLNGAFYGLARVANGVVRAEKKLC